MKKSIIKIICFLCILVISLNYVNKIFKVKYMDGIYGMTKFYELEKGSVDVLILGSSHAFQDFNTGTLWQEYGMASYILAGSIQPMWNTYYYLKEALKTQTPELIVLEGYLTTYDQEFIDDSRIIKNNYGLKWSADKINSIKISSPEDRWDEFLLEYIQYHTRYTELDSCDFLYSQGNPFFNDWKGFLPNMATTPHESIDVSSVAEKNYLYEKTEKYYRKTIELAQEHNIPIVIIISPYAGITKEHQKKYNAASDIAAEYNVPFINCNLLLDETGIDYSTDASDSAHLNYRGNQKFSSYIGTYLKSNFEISERTGDPKYDTWQKQADFIEQMTQDQILVETYDIDAIAELIQDPDYWLFMSVDGNCNTSDERLESFFHKLGIYDQNLNGIWFISNNKTAWYSGMEDAEQFINVSAHDFCMRRSLDESNQYINTIIFDNIQYQKVDHGINVLVFDTKTEKIADMFGINAEDGYQIVK